MNSRLALGTAQFGMSYGIANQTGQVNKTEAAAILKQALVVGIDTLDTAIAYGDAEKQLGEIGIPKWNVISKLPPIPEDCNNISAWVTGVVRSSVQCLGVDQLHGLLLHRPQDLLGNHGSKLYDTLNQLKNIGLVKKIGVSIYDINELGVLCSNYQIDIVQAPFNIIDRRLVDSGWLKSLVSKNIEVHARSVFLQGLLLMNQSVRPDKFLRWNNLWNIWQQWLADSRLTPLQACLCYALKQTQLSRIIVGVDSLNQFQEILNAVKSDIPDVPSELSSIDIDLINPGKW